MDIQCHVEPKNELGMVICKICGEVMYTLPTNGLKKFYLVCSKCIEKNKESESK